MITPTLEPTALPGARQPGDRVVIDPTALQTLLDALGRRGYRLIGPTVRDGAIIYDEIQSTTDLPIGWTDEQDGGMYRLKRRADEAYFGYNISPTSWKKFLHPPVLRLWSARRTDGSVHFDDEPAAPARQAFIGMRACELHAMAIQDRVFLEGPYVDSVYQARRAETFVVAVNCGQAGGTCFCVSMGTGPKATREYDLALTEVLDGGRHVFVVEIGTAVGAEVLDDVPHTAASPDDELAAARIVEQTAQHMGRSLDTAGLKELLYSNYDNPRWEKVATRCLSCANCTMVCPTCFCTTVDDVTDLTGERAERWRRWDSCFTTDYSYIHGGAVRQSPKARYRQWMMHKLATWIDQFGTSGCVGCGRCITWCPVGIDLTEEAGAIRAYGCAPLVETQEEKNVAGS
jgi:Fe-S-cluster-containing hydrogenase component 2